MSEEKRPVLSLKRKPAENSTAPAEATPAPGVVRRKKVVVVSSPPAWKAKKEKLEKVTHAAEAAPRNAAPVPVKAEKTPPPERYLLPPEQAIMTLKAFWPQLFDGNSPRLLATGMREQLFADIVNRDLPLSHKQVIKCLKSLTRSAGYLSRMKVGASRYDLQGNAVATVPAEEAQYASERMMK